MFRWKCCASMAVCRAALIFVCATTLRAAETPLPQAWDYAAAMQKIAGRFAGHSGVVLHVGDSITYANPYGGWARSGAGKTDADRAVLQWMHSGADDDTDGWWLARFDHPAGGRSYTACSGVRSDEMLAGGKQQMLSLEKIVAQYRPQIVVLMLGTNDATAGRSVDEFSRDMQRSVELLLSRGIIPIVSTIPPHVGQLELGRKYNAALRNLAQAASLPLVDFEQEILKRRPQDWDGTLLGKGDVHPTAGQGDVGPASAPTTRNLAESGYLLRGWLSVQKIAEVKRLVIDPPSKSGPPPKDDQRP
jgi:hypothetical protein